MSRTIKEIYEQSVETRKEYLELDEIHNDSKMSVMDAITWVTAAAIYSFESLMDVFMVDLVKVFQSRINGTPSYYANAMLKWQYGDELVINSDGTDFHYKEVNTAKRLITHVSYDEKYSSHIQDSLLVLKVAKDKDKQLAPLSEEELIAAKQYLQQIKFAGVNCTLVSRKGDVLVPKMTVYYDGKVEQDELYSEIEQALTSYINAMPFDSTMHVQKVIDAIQGVDHVTDVAFNSDDEGIFLAKYNDDGELEPLERVHRKSYMSSGYLKQSSESDQEASLPSFRNSIKLELEN